MHDLDTRALVANQLSGQSVQFLGELNQGAATASDDALLHSSTGGVERIFDPQLAVLEFGFRRCAHLDHGNTAGQFGDPLGQFLAVVLRLGVVKLPFDRGHTIVDGIAVILIGHDGGAVLGDGDAACTTKVLKRDLVQRHGPVFADHGAAGEDGDVGQRCLAALSEGRCANRSNLKHAAVLVDDQGGQGFAIHFLRQHHQGRS